MELKEAIKQLRSEKERKFDQTFDLIVNLKGMDFRKTNLSFVVSVPNKFKDKSVCAFLNEKSDLVPTITKPEFAVMIVDIDKLKEINDNHGHAEGDRVIGQAAEILKTSVRPADIVARVGGDEFVILVFKQDAKGEDTHLISKNILGGVTKKVGEGSMIGLTYGADTEKTFDDIKKVVESENPQQELTKIFSEADKALYIAKTGKKQAERKAIESSDYSI